MEAITCSTTSPAVAGAGLAVEDRTVARPTSLRLTRLVSLAFLALVLALLARGLTAVYYAFTDGLVRPLVLSPDSDAVIENRLRLGRLLDEREELAARLHATQAALTAAESAIHLLRDVETASSADLSWATHQAGAQARSSSADLVTLQAEMGVLSEILRREEAYVAELRRSLAAGLVHKADVERAQAALDQARVQLLKNDREQREARARLGAAALAREALTSRGPRSLLTPEMVALRQEQARLAVDVLKWESEREGRLAQQQADRSSLERLDRIIGDLRRRPEFRAIQASQTVAFVTYEELGHVHPGARVLRCARWGLFGCAEVGAIAEVLAGEISMADPWGATARGQLAVLHLTDPSAAQAKSLRVRGIGTTSARVRASVAGR